MIYIKRIFLTQKLVNYTCNGYIHNTCNGSIIKKHKKKKLVKYGFFPKTKTAKNYKKHENLKNRVFGYF